MDSEGYYWPQRAIIGLRGLLLASGGYYWPQGAIIGLRELSPGLRELFPGLRELFPGLRDPPRHPCPLPPNTVPTVRGVPEVAKREAQRWPKGGKVAKVAKLSCFSNLLLNNLVFWAGSGLLARLAPWPPSPRDP